MTRLRATLRFLALAVCLVPFTSAQQAAWAVAPVLPLETVPAGEMPGGPVNEEDDEREDPDGKEREAARASAPARVREGKAARSRSHPTHAHVHAAARTRAPVPADPLRNGLGTHYRC